jgi:hypothetical protein
MLTRVEVSCGDTDTWGVLPVFQASAETTGTRIADPDDEIGAANWFDRSTCLRTPATARTSSPLPTRSSEGRAAAS